MSKTLICAGCGYEIKEGDKYYKFKPGFPKEDYFEDESKNIFCSEICALSHTFLKEETLAMSGDSEND